MKTEPSYLHKEVDEPQRRDHHSCYGCGQEDNDAGSDDIEHGAHKHLDHMGNDGVNGIYLFGEAVHQVPAGRPLKKAHGASQDVVQQVEVEAARSKYPSD